MLRPLKIAIAILGLVGVLAALGPLGVADIAEWPPALAPDNDRELDALSQVAAISAWEGAIAIAPPGAQSRTHRVRSGDTIATILSGASLNATEAAAAVAALRKVYDPRRDLDVGDELVVTFERGQNGDMRFARMVFPVAFDRSVAVERERDGFIAKEILRPLDRRMVRVEGQITDSLYQTAQITGMSQQTVAQLIRIFSYDVDFQRDIQPGDRFEVLYEQVVDELGRIVHSGEIFYAAMTLSGETRELYRFMGQQDDIDYYNPKGESVRKALMRTPVDGARLSSGFGRRKHPMLGYNAMHTGVDFAAPSGTPIFAAGDGVVEEMGPKGGYGNYLRVRHGFGYATAYAHVSRFARGLKKGARVRQGDVIAYVGSTGRSTGPHLHFEVLQAGRAVNPVGLDLPSGRKLAGAELQKFAAQRASLQTRFAALKPLVIANAASPCATAEEARTPARAAC